MGLFLRSSIVAHRSGDPRLRDHKSGCTSGSQPLGLKPLESDNPFTGATCDHWETQIVTLRFIQEQHYSYEVATEII